MFSFIPKLYQEFYNGIVTLLSGSAVQGSFALTLFEAETAAKIISPRISVIKNGTALLKEHSRIFSDSIFLESADRLADIYGKKLSSHGVVAEDDLPILDSEGFDAPLIETALFFQAVSGGDLKDLTTFGHRHSEIAVSGVLSSPPKVLDHKMDNSMNANFKEDLVCSHGK